MSQPAGPTRATRWIGIVCGLLLVTACSADQQLEINGSWELESIAVDGEPYPLPETSAQFRFSTSSLLIDGFCNSHQASLRLDGDELEFENGVTTAAACEPPELMDADAVVFTAMKEQATATRSGETLKLEARGVVLELTLVP